MIAVLGLPSLFNNKADYIEATFAVDMVFEDDLIEPKKTAEEEIKTKVTLKKPPHNNPPSGRPYNNPINNGATNDRKRAPLQ